MGRPTDSAVHTDQVGDADWAWTPLILLCSIATYIAAAMSLAGMMIKNAIVLIDEINLNLGDGLEPYEAVMQAAMNMTRLLETSANLPHSGADSRLASPPARMMGRYGLESFSN